MQEHNPSLILVIVPVDSRKLERIKASQKQSTTRGSDERRLSEVANGAFPFEQFYITQTLKDAYYYC